MSQNFAVNNGFIFPLAVLQGGTGVTTSTGSGNIVLSTSPTLTTPIIGAATATSVKFSNTGLLDTNGAVALALSATASAVNGFTLTNSIATASPSLAATGSDTNIIMTLNGKGTGGVAAKGTSTNDNAVAGYVGEIISSVIPSASSVSITSTVAKDVTSISLTAGDWDVWGNVGFTGAATTVVNFGIGWISLTTATIPDPSLYSTTDYNPSTTSTTLPGGVFSINVPMIRISINSTNTVFLSVRSTFTTSTCTALGAIYARRIR